MVYASKLYALFNICVACLTRCLRLTACPLPSLFSLVGFPLLHSLSLVLPLGSLLSSPPLICSSNLLISSGLLFVNLLLFICQSYLSIVSVVRPYCRMRRINRLNSCPHRLGPYCCAWRGAALYSCYWHHAWPYRCTRRGAQPYPCRAVLLYATPRPAILGVKRMV